MIPNALTEFVLQQRSQPLSVAVCVAALFLPTTLTIFLSTPSLFQSVGLNGVLVLSFAASLPILMLCFGLWYTPMSVLLSLERLIRGIKDSDDDLATKLNRDDPLEWPCLLSAGWTANALLFVISALAYRHPLRVGATYLLTASILAGLWLIVFVIGAIVSVFAHRRWAQMQAKGQSVVAAQTQAPARKVEPS